MAARTAEEAEARTAAVGARTAEAYAAADGPTSPAGVPAGSTAAAPGSTAAAGGPAAEEAAEPQRPAAEARAGRSLAAGMLAASRRIPASPVTAAADADAKP